ncbi:hypothetical protein [Psychrobacter sanguinis]|uniref:Uncharacterized protein n=1 Tax=Psychrobacter sanguinis TaxID=861445 RepID=A0A844M1A6_9GAMM|nr:hypothetical protein [Psychrobacter sanguinis]MUG32563.1 hypothetical protein [Psychrobacter sanguinis]
MTLKITFDEDAFQKNEEPDTNFEKPEFKKFNMRFNNLDLVIIDAIAKRNGTSRSQIINDFIEAVLKDFLTNCSEDEALLMCKYAESLSEDKIKNNKDFSWDSWYGNWRYGWATEGHLYQAVRSLSEDIENNNASTELLRLLKLLKMSKSSLESTT